MRIRPSSFAPVITAAALAVSAALMPQLRPYQTEVIKEVQVEWLKGSRNVLAVSATGSGKTVIFSDIIRREGAPVCAVAHRHELVSQMSMALARCGIRHRIIGSDALARECRANHLEEFGVSYVDPNSTVAVASVDTLVKMDANDPWFASVRLWVMDEAHHVLKHNKWGTAVGMFPNARGLGVTAETERADGYGLGAHNDGVFHAMVLAPTMRDLINMGYLTDYRVFVPPSNLDRAALQQAVSATTGDYSQKKLAKATKAAKITGDVVTHYLRHAAGKLGITFAVDIEAATEIAAAFRAAGVPAEVVSSKTDPARRRDVLRDFKARRILQLVNVDLFGEGFDLPAIEVVSMARATKSFNLFKQQFGRALRLLDGKQWAIIIDHVGNVMEHGLPDKRKEFSLGRPVPKAQRAPDEDLIPQRICDECTQPYDRDKYRCPYCNALPPLPLSRKAPEYVDGDLTELDPEFMAQMRGETERIFAPAQVPQHLKGTPAARAIENNHFRRAQSIHHLQQTMALWAGWQRALGRDDKSIYRLFFLTYGKDMATAQTLGASDADELRDKLQARLNQHNVVAM